MADMSRKAAVALRVDLDTSGIKQRAEEISQKIKEALERNKDTQDPRIAALLKDLKTLDHSLDITKRSLNRLSIDPKTGQSLSQVTARVNESREAALAAKKAYDDYVKSLESTQRGRQVMANIRNIGSEDTKAKYFGANADKRKMVEQFQVLNEEVTRTRFALKAAQEEWNKFDSRAATSENGIAKALTRDSEAGGVLLLRLNELEKKYEDTGKTASKSSSSFRSGFYFARTIINDINRNLSKLCDRMKQFAKSVLNAAKNMLHLRKESHKASTTMSDGIKHALRNIMRYGLGVRSLYFLFRRLRTYAKEALGEMAKAFPEVNTQMSRAVTALNHMKGALGTAIQPLLTVLVPVLEKVAALITKILNLIGSVFALLTGQKSIYSAVAVQTDYAASLEKTGSAAKKAKKELEGYLSPIDEINKYKSKRDDEDSSDSGADGGLKFVEQPISAFAQKIKDILDKIMAPIKKAWAQVGDFVKTAWTKAFKSIKDLVKDIGRDFLEVWNQPATVAMLEDIFRIVGGIGTIIDAIAVKLDIAWNKNETGKKILEAIRDIFAIIVSHIKNAVQYTENWAMQLDFVPLLTAVKDWLESVKPLVDSISGVFEDFYKNVILKFAKFVIEDEKGGLPAFLQMLEDFNKKVDWGHLRAELNKLWLSLEPFMERVGEGLLMFLNDLAQNMAEFINGEGFDNIIDFLTDLMDSISAEDVYNTLNAVANILPVVAIGIFALKGAFSALSSVLPIIGIVLKAIEFFGAHGAAAAAGAGKIASGIAEIAGGATAVEGALTGAGAAAEGAEGALTGVGVAGSATGGIIAAAVAVMVAAFVTLWNTSEEFKNDMVAIWKEIKDAFSEFTNTMVPKLKVFWSTTKSGFLEIFNFIKPIVSALKDVWLNFCNFLAPEFKAAWDVIKIVLKTTLTLLEGYFDVFAGVFTGNWSQVWNGCKTIFKGILQSILDLFGNLLNRVVDHINNFAGSLNGMSVLGYTVNIPVIHHVQMPRLAQGAVIPPNKEFMAVLGDQKSGTNIETPLSTMVDAFNQALAQNGGGQKITLNLMLPDKRTVAQYAIEGGQVLQMSRGRNPFLLERG